MGPGQVGLEVDPGNGVGVVQDRPGAVAPGGVGDKAMGIALEAVGTEHRIAAVTQLPGRFQATHMHHARLAHQGQALGAQYLVEEVRQGGLQLGDFLALVAGVIGTGARRDRRGGVSGNRIDQGQGQVGGVQLYRCVGPVAQLAAPGRAG
ncbi:hypothetical protein D3C84_150270 [compost metagenome]